jgi:hypothetical protein
MHRGLIFLRFVRENLELVSVINDEVAQIEKLTDCTLANNIGPSAVRRAKAEIRSRSELDNLASDLNLEPSAGSLQSEAKHLAESLRILTSARDRLLRVCELRRRQVKEMASLTSSLVEDIVLEP